MAGIGELRVVGELGEAKAVRRGAAAMEVNVRGHAVVLVLEAEDAGDDDHGRT